jgi:hypothetical protein
LKNMPKAFQILIAVGLIAVVVLVIRQQRHAADAAGWDAVGQAERAGGTVESLREASQSAKGTSAEPWAAVRLALALYDEGGASNRDQARSIAQQALDRFADHPAAAHLSKLVAAVDSLRPAS